MEYVDIKLHMCSYCMVYTMHIAHISYIPYNMNTCETDVKHNTHQIKKPCISHSHTHSRVA